MDLTKNTYIVEHKEQSPGLRRLETIGEVRILPDDTVLAYSGDKIVQCYLVIRGRVVAYEYKKNGEKRVYYYSGKGTLIMEEYLLTGQDCPIEYRTHGEAELIKINRCQLLQAVSMNSDIAKDVLNAMAEKIVFSGQQLRYEKIHNAGWKVCNVILDFVKRHGVETKEGIVIREKISQKQIADILGMNRITITREMKKLKEEKIVGRAGEYYCVWDIERLRGVVMK